jgi:hypothetical protein
MYVINGKFIDKRFRAVTGLLKNSDRSQRPAYRIGENELNVFLYTPRGPNLISSEKGRRTQLRKVIVRIGIALAVAGIMKMIPDFVRYMKIRSTGVQAL